MSGMKSWSTTPANNVLANTGFTMDEGQAPSTLNDSIRQAMADIRTEWAQGANIASAATVDLSTATGGYVHITGVVTITSFGTVSAGIRRRITFDGALTLTHNASSLILPTGGNITTVAGDTCEAMSEGSGNWRVLWYAGKNVQATNVTATTSVVTPLVSNSGADLLLDTISGNTNIRLQPRGGGNVIPNDDNVHTFGVSTNRWSAVFTPIIDTGTTGSGALKTNNGTTVLTWDNNGGVAWGTGVANRGTITKRKTADESVTSSTVLQDDDHLTFAIAANEEWVAVYDINFTGTFSGSGLKIGFTTPAGATQNYSFTILSNSSPTGFDTHGNGTASGTILSTGAQATMNTSVHVHLYINCVNGATPGSVTFQFAQSVSTGTAVIGVKGSFLQATRVA